MGYAVLHLEKAKRADSGMSAHIERTIQSKNTDPTRTHLNRELIQFPDGVRNRTAAIQHRLNTAIRRLHGIGGGILYQAPFPSFQFGLFAFIFHFFLWNAYYLEKFL